MKSIEKSRSKRDAYVRVKVGVATHERRARVCVARPCTCTCVYKHHRRQNNVIIQYLSLEFYVTVLCVYRFFKCRADYALKLYYVMPNSLNVLYST